MTITRTLNPSGPAMLLHRYQNVKAFVGFRPVPHLLGLIVMDELCFIVTAEREGETFVCVAEELIEAVNHLAALSAEYKVKA